MFTPKKLHNLLSPLVATNTVSADHAAQDISNRQYCEILANSLENLNFQCRIEAVPETRNKWNLIAHRPGRRFQTGGLLFAGHSDTVPAQVAHWQQDPWVLKEQPDRFSGLGVTDMKGFFAVILAVFEQQTKALDRPVSVIATADEETSMAGARAIKAETLPAPALTIIGEPTGMRPIVSHKGYLAYRIKLTSQGGHSSLNSSHLNCIEAMQSIIGQLTLWRNRLQQHTNQQFKIPVSTINFGRLTAGDALNRICAVAELELDIRPLPGLDSRQLLNELESKVQQGILGFKVTYQLEEIYPAVEGFQSSLSPQLTHCLTHCCNSSPATADYVTEAPWFERQGWPSLVLGPGQIDQAHKPNEWVSFSQLKRAMAIYQKILHTYSGAGGKITLTD